MQPTRGEKLDRLKIIAGALLVAGLIGSLGFAYQLWYYEHRFKSPEEAFQWAQTCKVITLVFATRDIPKDSIIAPDMLEKVYRWQPIYPQLALSDPAEAIGKRTRYGVQKGQMLSSYLFGPVKHPWD